MRLRGAIPALLWLAALSRGGHPAPQRVRQPEAAAGEFTVRVNQILRSRTAALTFGPEPPAPDRAALSRGMIQLQLVVNSKVPNAGLRVAGLTSDIVAIDDQGRPIDLIAYLIGAGPAGAALTLSGTIPSVTSQELRLLYGELIVYRHAQRVRVQVPWPASGEGSPVEVHGVLATLRRAIRDGTILKVRLRVEVRDGNLGTDEPWGWGEPPVRLLDASGAPLSAGDITYQSAPAGPNYREYVMEFRGIRGLPSRVAVDVLARTGEPQIVPFRLEGIRLPDFQDRDQSGGPGRNPYIDSGSGSALASQVVIDGKPAGPGVLLHGLSRQQRTGSGGAWGAWRWLEVPTDAQGRAVVANLKPGRYRVTRQWHPQQSPAEPPAPRGPGWSNSRVEILVPKDRSVTLPPLELR